MGKIVSLRDLELHYANHSLTEFVKGIDNDNINRLIGNIMADDIIGDRINILGLLNDELEYRCLNEFISVKDSEFISKFYDFYNEKNVYNEFKNSFNELSQLENFSTIIKWCPILLFFNKAYKIYNFFKSVGKDDAFVINLFCTQFKYCLELADNLDDKYNNRDKIYDFHNMIHELSLKVSNDKSGTESYQYYTENIMKENANLLKRLS